ncbi:IS701 family transposase, partial [Streptomyces sp. NPDC001205]
MLLLLRYEHGLGRLDRLGHRRCGGGLRDVRPRRGLLLGSGLRYGNGDMRGRLAGPQYFLSESHWDSDQINARRLELLRTDPALAP